MERRVLRGDACVSDGDVEYKGFGKLEHLLKWNLIHILLEAQSLCGKEIQEWWF